MVNNKEEAFIKLAELAKNNSKIDLELYTKYNVKRGLRNADGTGVLVGLTEVGDVHGYIIDENEKVPAEGRLSYRGIDVAEIIKGFQKEKRFGFEEVCYLLLFGNLPGKEELAQFQDLLDENRKLPEGFTENMILKAPSNDVMNKLARSILVSYSYDKNPDDINIKNVLRQSIELIAGMPTMAAYGYQAKAHYYDGKSLFIHNPVKGMGAAQNLLHMIRPDSKYTQLEAEILDLALVLHAEHGGGNNSSFTTHVVTSSDTDTYSAIAASIGSLKGPKHGGANIRVIKMMEDIKANVKNWGSESEVSAYLAKIVNKQAYDKTGLIYGLGHAVYTKSDPRAVILKVKAAELAKEKNRLEEYNLYTIIERLAPSIFNEIKKSNKVISANVDFYSGFVYGMLDIPKDLYTPIFAISRVSGWCAHRIEELVSGGRIIRPAYKSVVKKREYTPLEKR
ncbi:MAG: citrate synthase [Elusimicrobia bacterium RIFOXYA2_FULL_39_19]|nr:MAG: citrate synthase [Elusimicrobia bacterium RIFOXYA2_FULL_39_19]